MGERRVQAVEEFMPGRELEQSRRLAQAVKNLQKGRGNNHFDVTLTASATSTTVIVEFADTLSVALLSPLSASAAQALAAGVIWCEPQNGQVVVHHDSDPATDRRFGMVVVG